MGRTVKSILMCMVLLAVAAKWRNPGAMVAKAQEEGKEGDKTIKGYLVETKGPDGKNGYSSSFPGVRLFHRDEGLVTKYRFLSPQGEECGILTSENPEKFWEEAWEDGAYVLELSLEEEEGAEDSAGEGEPVEEDVGKEEEPVEEDAEKEEEPVEEDVGKEEEPAEEDAGKEEEPVEEDAGKEEESYDKTELEIWHQKWEWKVDGTPPLIYRTAPQKDQIWYQDGVLLEAHAVDAGSGVSGMKGGYKNQEVTGSKEEIRFSVRETSVNGNEVKVWVEAEDQAGNKARVEWGFLLDGKPPLIQIDGAQEYAILSDVSTLDVRIQEENILQAMSLVLEKTRETGEKEQIEFQEWSRDGQGDFRQQIRLEEDAIYQIQVEAQDAAGRRTTLARQVIVDRTIPKILEPEKFEGKYLKEFCWEYEKEKLVEDLTSCNKEICLDGKLYGSGKKIRSEGRHILLVSVRDAAGNVAENRNCFIIDRTAPEICCTNKANGKPVKEQEVFEEAAEIQVNVGQSGEWIGEIVINGRRKNIQEKTASVICRLEDTGAYEIRITAKDQAGNQAVKWVGVQIKEAQKESGSRRESLIQAIKKGFTLKRRTEPSEETQFADGTQGNQEGRAKKQSSGGIGSFLTCLGSPIVSMVLIRYFKRKSKTL